MAYSPTPEAFELFRWVELGKGNAIVEAVAGAGKTTNIIEALNYIPEDESVLACSFTNEAATQLGEKIKAEGFSNVSSSTLNSAGWGMCRTSGYRPQIDKMKTYGILGNYFPYRFRDDGQMVMYNTLKSLVAKLVGLGKGHAWTPGEFALDWPKLVQKFSLDLPEREEAYLKLIEVVPQVYMDSYELKHIMDLDDQKFMPVMHNFNAPKYKWLIVDEAQDCNICDLKLVQKLLRPDGRAIFVGDRNQAIYMFRGSLSDAMDQIATRFNTTSLPLSDCWRCPEVVIQAAQKIVPQIRSPKPNPNGEGTLKSVSFDDFYEMVQPGDYCLSRTTAVVVSACLRLLARGTKASVLGKEVGGQIKDLIRDIVKLTGVGEPPLDLFLAALRTYKEEQVARLTKLEKEDIAEMISDRCETLELFCQEAEDLNGVTLKIDELFVKDKTPGVLLMTGHKCKGLQAKRVFFLRPDLCPSPRAKTAEAQQQEMNLKYVMMTRAQRELYFVNKDSSDASRPSEPRPGSGS